MRLISSLVAPPQQSSGERRPQSVDRLGVESIIVCVAVLLAPFATWRYPDLFFTVSDLFYCISLFLLLVSGRLPRAPLRQFTPFWFLAFSLLMGGLVVSSLLNGDPIRGLVVTIQYFFSYVLLLFILLRDSEVEAHRLAKIFLVSVVLVDIHGIATFYTVGYVPGSMIVSGARRLATLLEDANLAAAINSLTLPTLLYFWLSGRVSALLAVPSLAVMLITVVLTSSNSGLIAACFSLTVFLISAMSRHFLWRVLLLAGICAVAIYAGGLEVLPRAFRERVLEALTTGDVTQAGTFDSRVELLKEAIQIIGDKGIFLVGLGADQFRVLSVQGAPVHNLYLLLWAEGGVFALFGWLCFFVVVFALWLTALQRRVDRNVGAAMISTIGVFLLVASANAHMYARYWLTPVLLSVGLVVAQLRSPSSGPLPRRVAPSMDQVEGAGMR